MMSHHIGASARQAILKELVIRVQKHVVDVTSPWYDFGVQQYLIQLIKHNGLGEIRN